MWSEWNWSWQHGYGYCPYFDWSTFIRDFHKFLMNIECRFKSALVRIPKSGRDRAPHGRLFPDVEVV